MAILCNEFCLFESLNSEKSFCSFFNFCWQKLILFSFAPFFQIQLPVLVDIRSVFQSKPSIALGRRGHSLGSRRLRGSVEYPPDFPSLGFPESHRTQNPARAAPLFPLPEPGTCGLFPLRARRRKSGGYKLLFRSAGGGENLAVFASLRHLILCFFFRLLLYFCRYRSHTVFVCCFLLDKIIYIFCSIRFSNNFYDF